MALLQTPLLESSGTQTLVPQVYDYDIDFAGGMDRIRQAKERARGAPLDYERRGGVSLLRSGEMYPAFLAAGLKSRRDLAEQRRRQLWEQADMARKAQATRAIAENIRNRVVGETGIAEDYFSQYASRYPESEFANAYMGGSGEFYLEGGEGWGKGGDGRVGGQFLDWKGGK